MIGIYAVRVVFEKIGLFSPFTYGVALVAAVVAGLVIPVLLTRFVIYKSKSLTFLMGGK